MYIIRQNWIIINTQSINAIRKILFWDRWHWHSYSCIPVYTNCLILKKFVSFSLHLENYGLKTPSYTIKHLFLKYDNNKTIYKFFILFWSRIISWWPTVHVLYTPSPILHHALDSKQNLKQPHSFSSRNTWPLPASLPVSPLDNNTKPCILSIKDPQLLINLVHNFTKFLHFRYTNHSSISWIVSAPPEHCCVSAFKKFTRATVSKILHISV